VLNPITFSLLLIAGLFFPSIASAGPLEGLVGTARELVGDVTGILTVLLGGYGAYVAFQWYSGSPDAKRSTGFLLVGGTLLFSVDQIIASLGGA
jgi:hypothetical protein